MNNWKIINSYYVKNFIAVPVAYRLDKNILRIFYSKRNSKNYSLPHYIHYDISRNKFFKKKKLNLQLGKIGEFDEHGIMPTEIVFFKKKYFLYYIGWSQNKKNFFRNSIGLAVSADLINFKKKFCSPIIDRSKFDKCFVASCGIYSDSNKLHMAYLSCNNWVKVRNNKFEASYNIKYAFSKNGIDWERKGLILLNFKKKYEYALSTPRIIKNNKYFHVWYSYKGDKRNNKYKIGYANGKNLFSLERKDNKVSFNYRNKKIPNIFCYPYVIKLSDKKSLIFFNKNNYGKNYLYVAIN